MEFLHYMAIPSHITYYLLCHFDLFLSKPVNRKRKRPFQCLSVLPRESECDWKEYLIEAFLQFMQYNFPTFLFLTSLCWILEVQRWFGSGRLSLEIKRNVFLLNTQICKALAGFRLSLFQFVSNDFFSLSDHIPFLKQTVSSLSLKSDF